MPSVANVADALDSKPRTGAELNLLLDWVCGIQFFLDNCGSNHRRLELCRSFDLVLADADEVICAQGQVGDSFYALVSGEAVITIDGERPSWGGVISGGMPITDDAVEAGTACFGERSLSEEGGLRTATVTAQTECILARLGAADYRRSVDTERVDFDAASAAVARQAIARQASEPEPAGTDDVLVDLDDLDELDDLADLEKGAETEPEPAPPPAPGRHDVKGAMIELIGQAAASQHAATLRAELVQMKPRALKVRAIEIGIQEEQIDSADDNDNVKDALVAMIKQHSEALHLAKLRSELYPMKVQKLKLRAAALGISKKQLDEIDPTATSDESLQHLYSSTAASTNSFDHLLSHVVASRERIVRERVDDIIPKDRSRSQAPDATPMDNVGPSSRAAQRRAARAAKEAQAQEEEDRLAALAAREPYPRSPQPPPPTPPPQETDNKQEYCLLVTSPLFSESRLCTLQAACLEDLHTALLQQIDVEGAHAARGTLEIYFRDARFGGERVLLADLSHLPSTKTRVEVTLRREFQVLASATDERLFAGKRNVKLQASDREQFVSRLASKLSLNARLKVFFYDAEYGQKFLLTDANFLVALPYECRLEVEEVGYVPPAEEVPVAPASPTPAASEPQSPPAEVAPAETSVRTFKLLVGGAAIKQPRILKITTESLHELKQKVVDDFLVPQHEQENKEAAAIRKKQQQEHDAAERKRQRKKKKAAQRNEEYIEDELPPPPPCPTFVERFKLDSISIYFVHEMFQERVELSDDSFDDLPEKAKIEVEFEALSTYQLTLIVESSGTMVECELEAEDIHQLIAGIKHRLDLDCNIRLFCVDDDDGGKADEEVRDLSVLGLDTTLRVVDEPEEEEEEPEPEPEEEEEEIFLPPPPSKPREPEPEPELEPEPDEPVFLDLPAPPPVDNGPICSDKLGLTEQKYDFGADFTMEWWQGVCFRSPMALFGAEIAGLDCWPALSLTAENLGTISRTNPGKLANSVQVREFVGLFDSRHTSAQTVFRLFIAQHDCSSRNWDIVQLLTLCNPTIPVPNRLAESMRLFVSGGTGGAYADIDRNVMQKWMGGVKRISEAVLLRFLDSTATLCGTESGESVCAESMEKAVKSSLECLTSDLRTAKVPLKKSSSHTIPVAQFVTTASKRVVRLSDWMNGLSAYMFAVSSLADVHEEHEEDIRCSTRAILAAFQSSERQRSTSVDAEMEVNAAYKWTIRMNLASSMSIRRVIWLLTRGHGMVRTRDLVGALVALSKEGSTESKLKAMLTINCVTSGRRWTLEDLQAALRPLILLGIDALSVQANALRTMFRLDAGVCDVVLRAAYERMRQNVQVWSLMADRLITTNPMKSALHVAVHAWTKRCGVGLWLATLHRTWTASFWMERIAARAHMQRLVQGIRLPPKTSPPFRASLITAPVARLCQLICQTTGNSDEFSVSGNTDEILHAIGHSLGSRSGFEGARALEVLALNGPGAMKFAAVCLSGGVAADKVSATLAVLGVPDGADMGMHTDIWCDTFQVVALHIIEDLKSTIANLCGGADERHHSEVQAQCNSILDSITHPHLTKTVKMLQKLGYTAQIPPSVFARRAGSEVLQKWLDNCAVAWLPMLHVEDHKPLSVQTAAMQRFTAQYGRYQYEIGKSKGLLPTADAYKLAAQLGYSDHTVIARLLWLCDSAADENHDGGAVWARDYCSLLLVASAGNPLDKHHSLLALNGLTAKGNAWGAAPIAHSRSALFRALRPVLALAMDCAVCHLTAFEACGGLGEEQQQARVITRILLKSVKLRSLVFLESLVESLAHPPDSVPHSQALKKLCRWLETVSASWLQLSRYRFGVVARAAAAGADDTVIEPSWATSLRPDAVGFTCGSSPLSKGHCAVFPIIEAELAYDESD